MGQVLGTPPSTRRGSPSPCGWWWPAAPPVGSVVVSMEMHKLRNNVGGGALCPMWVL